MTDLPRISRLTPRRGLSCSEAATYIGLSQTKFLSLVSDGRMPHPIRIDRRAIWDIHDLDAAFDALHENKIAGRAEETVDDGWGDETP